MELRPADPSMDDIYQLAEMGGAGTEPATGDHSAATMEAAPLVVGFGESRGGNGLAATESGSAGAEGTSTTPGDASQPPSPTANGAEGGSGRGSEAAAARAPKAPRLRPTRRGRIRLAHLLQAWSFSLVVHAAILSALAFATFTGGDTIKQVLNFDSALAGHRAGEQEILPIYADPDNIKRDQAIGDEHANTPGEPAMQVLADDAGGGEGDDGGGVIVAGGQGVGRPSNTPRVRGAGRGRINEGNSLPGVKIDGLAMSPLNLLPVAPATDLGGGGKIAGDPIFEVKEIGAAMDQLAREIIRHLKEQKVTVIWLFDESISMEDDKRTVLEKFDRVSSELKKYIAEDKERRNSGVLNHAIYGFGQGIDPIRDKPSDNIDMIGGAIKRLRIDSTGIEVTMRAIREVAEHYAALVRKDRKVLIVLVTDESGDDGMGVEEARQALKRKNIPLYVIGRQSLFGYPFAHHRYEDPVTHDVYHPQIRRGPETADLEVYQWDGLYERWDEQPSGFAPYELARLTRESGGIYFVLPTEEFMRMRHREQAYSITQLKEYMPEYDNRLTYIEKRTASPLRRPLYEIVSQAKDYRYQRDFPVELPKLVAEALREGQKADLKLGALLAIQKRLEELHLARDREPQKRWQAHYDLMLAQTVAFQVKAYEYEALMASIVQRPPTPRAQPRADLMITWVVDHAREPLAPRNKTAKKYLEAERLLKEVIAKHPKTPWADLAQDTLNRGFSVKLNEWHHNPDYYNRSKFVPKY
jgi:von Willebrand factor type A domain